MKTLAQIKEEGRMPTIDEIRDFYEDIATPRESDGWFGSTQHIEAGFGRVQFCLEHIEEGMSVLELGCADGGVLKHLAKAAGNGYVCGVDISPTFVQKAAKYVPKADVVVADACTYQTRRRFDVVVVTEVMEHVPEPRQLLANAYGLLRKGTGKMLITVPVDWDDALGEHLHNFEARDVAVIIGDATGLHVPIEQRGDNFYAVVDKRNNVPYVP